MAGERPVWRENYPMQHDTTILMKPIEILLVEDNPGDVDLTREALEGGKLRNNLHVVGDGEAAMAFLRKEGSYANVPRPGLGAAGPQPARKMAGKSWPNRKPTTISHRASRWWLLTTSHAEEDIHKSYNLHANCYVTKPIDLSHFIKVVHAIEDFWLTIVELPKNGNK